MKQQLERALYELCYALAELEQARAANRWPQGAAQDFRIAEKGDSVIVLLRLSQWGLETALRALGEIDAAQARQPG
ncbi:hypothetical protein GJ654_17490 [Rhodoblastus acidophilus]|uniref:Uncharacterized protein n=1 Tax=Rhodoblastus acidophilus TaxID=1074 RepID=A0A6N8DQN2_RHOAC|nr:hypothetical protein [Rhodoblastus acidophilus]MCW2276042.1 hypothetical protein [Rhodoblastus acidophilus]MTV32779.1 hypothetical protein [Rhodoblastus acidophilus]